MDEEVCQVARTEAANQFSIVGVFSFVNIFNNLVNEPKDLCLISVKIQSIFTA
jgi:hypothetical protein